LAKPSASPARATEPHAAALRNHCAQAALSGHRFQLEAAMKRLFVCAAILAAFTSAADAKGCIKGAIVGGVAGHYAGHHGTLGAIAGCVVGRHEANKADAANRDNRRNNPRAPDDGRI
jgi:hypothetical protein